MIEYVLLGLIQGIFEWLPVSSEGILTITSTYLQFANPVELALYLHLGTMFSAIIYFRKEILSLPKQKKLLNFLAISTITSFAIALPVYLFIKIAVGQQLMLLTGIALIITGFLLQKNRGGRKKVSDFNSLDAVFAGALQGFAVIPGFSRSGSTLFALLFRNYDQETALKTSFLMSIPVVLGANIFLNLTDFVFQPEYLISLLTAFFVGLISMNLLLKFSRKISFSLFCWFFGLLSIIGFFY